MNSRDSWQGSYAVLMTLLFGLFVTLYSSTKADLLKAKREIKKAKQTESTQSEAFSQMQSDLQASTEQKVEESGGAIHLSFAPDDRGLIVRISTKEFFEENSVVARKDVEPVLDQIGKVLATVPNGVRVEGHSDETEPSGWELSSARAATVVRFWIDHDGLSPSRLSAAGVSHFHPIVLSQSPNAKHPENRRVEIIVLK